MSIGGAGPKGDGSEPILPKDFEIAGITRVAIIDDAFDPPPPRVEDLPAGDIESFVQALASDPDLATAAELTGHDIASALDVTDSVVTDMWSLADYETVPGQPPAEPLAAACAKTLFGAYLERRQVVERLVGHLSGLGLKVQKLGTSDPVPGRRANERPQLVFLDFYLGTEQQKQSIQAAVAKAKELYAACPRNEMPLIVLMSSDPNVVTLADTFRDDSGLLQGMFQCITKAQLDDEYERQLHMQAIARSLPAGRVVQSLTKGIERKIKVASRDFVEGIRGLSLDDYAYIQRLSLQEDGHPLGDYLFWLFSTYMGQKLFGGALREDGRRLDSMVFQDALPAQRPPSVMLAEIFKAALFELDVGPLRPHPRAGDIAATANLPKEPYLSLGDVFIKDATEPREVLMIINAQCDLSFAPGADRRVASDRSVVFIPGELQPLSRPFAKAENTAPATELFEYGKRSYRILWRPKQVLTRPYGDVAAWLDSEGYKPVARLRLPYALEVQRAFTADLSRVGMPVAPPIFERVRVQVTKCGTSRKLDEVVRSDNLAFVVLTAKGHRCVLTIPLRVQLRKLVRERVSQLDAAVAGMHHEPGDLEKVSKKWARQMERFRQMKQQLNDEAAWDGLNEPLEMPARGKLLDVKGLPVALGRDRPTKGTCDTDTPYVVVNILDYEEALA
jgi:hypothetical protein